MDRRTAITTARTTALRIVNRSSKVALRVGHEVSERLAARRAARPTARPAPPPSPATPPTRAGTTTEPTRATPRGPSPADVARAVQRNAAGLTRANPRVPRTPRPRSTPGAKLPARAGRGILGV